MNFSRAYEIGSWEALDSKVPPRGTCRRCGKRIATAHYWCRACSNWEKSEEARAERDRDFEIYRTTPHASVCFLGKDRFFWCVLAAPDSRRREYETWFDAVLASGYAATRDEARAAVQSACPNFVAQQNQIAADVHHTLSARKRAAKAKPNDRVKDSVGTEYIYGFHQGEDRGYWYQYRIIRKTKKRIWIYHYQHNPEHWPNDPEMWRSISLDREKLERDGRVNPGRGWWMPSYYNEEGKRQSDAEQAQREAEWRRWRAENGSRNDSRNQPGCFTMLGLSFDCTQKDVKRAFRRKSREAHPDNGGSHAAFIELRQAYEQAMRLCSGDKVVTP